MKAAWLPLPCFSFASSTTKSIPNIQCCRRQYLTLLLLPLAFLNLLLPSICAFWLPPDYWITIYGNQQLEYGRSKEALITFPEVKNAYIGYWIDHNEAHHEAYGNVFALLDDEKQQQQQSSSRNGGGGIRYCGQFADAQANRSRHICGRFRLLARQKHGSPSAIQLFKFVPTSVVNPFLAVEYLDSAIAMIRLDNAQWVYGGARLAERRAFAAHPSGNGPLIQISFAKSPRDYVERVRILQRTMAFPASDLLNDSRPHAHPPPQLPPIPARTVPEIPTRTEPDVHVPKWTTTTARTTPIVVVPETSSKEREKTTTTTTSTTTATTTAAMTTTTKEISEEKEELDKSTTTIGNEIEQPHEDAMGAIPPDEVLPEQQSTTTTTMMPAFAEEYEELSGAGVGWGADGGEEAIEQREEETKKQRRRSDDDDDVPSPLPSSAHNNNNNKHRRHHHRHRRFRFRHKHPPPEDK